MAMGSSKSKKCLCVIVLRGSMGYPRSSLSRFLGKENSDPVASVISIQIKKDKGICAQLDQVFNHRRNYIFTKQGYEKKSMIQKVGIPAKPGEILPYIAMLLWIMIGKNP
ncbi:hypothetical protein K501DRAFT_273984 [Backusella circina FSU 941]|nr:hypothetical protein K501DRAFT_273984 [Backusella circina FSU 941]